jgi:hypothetical protein
VVGVSDPLEGISAEELRRRHFTPREVTTEREFRCSECGCRCTLLTDGTTEAGHGRNCSQRLRRTGGARVTPAVTDGGEEVRES